MFCILEGEWRVHHISDNSSTTVLELSNQKTQGHKTSGCFRSFQPLFCRRYLSRQLLYHPYSSFASSFKPGTARTAGLKCDTTHHNLMRPLGLHATQPRSPCTYKHTHTVNQNREHLAKHPRALFKEKKNCDLSKTLQLPGRNKIVFPEYLYLWKLRDPCQEWKIESFWFLILRG